MPHVHRRAPRDKRHAPVRRPVIAREQATATGWGGTSRIRASNRDADATEHNAKTPQSENRRGGVNGIAVGRQPGRSIRRDAIGRKRAGTTRYVTAGEGRVPITAHSEQPSVAIPLRRPPGSDSIATSTGVTAILCRVCMSDAPVPCRRRTPSVRVCRGADRKPEQRGLCRNLFGSPRRRSKVESVGHAGACRTPFATACSSLGADRDGRDGIGREAKARVSSRCFGEGDDAALWPQNDRAAFRAQTCRSDVMLMTASEAGRLHSR